MKIEALTFLRAALEANPPAVFKPHVEQLSTGACLLCVCVGGYVGGGTGWLGGGVVSVSFGGVLGGWGGRVVVGRRAGEGSLLRTALEANPPAVFKPRVEQLSTGGC